MTQAFFKLHYYDNATAPNSIRILNFDKIHETYQVPCASFYVSVKVSAKSHSLLLPTECKSFCVIKSLIDNSI